ncbi:hypothetical protein GCM10029976_020430 [Kribbella albertanoniae]|uniref:Uncharacterized protein n=1 Tax=Kribbella albertanoniae TaxID=1266829 RepID=A0A4R4P7X7_9ACTN|nr:hypothetical protein [Kribbella albertanoniae]TDC16917.1 hypothetical protein E1261_38090 [Kribbella albertanoniae]
MHELLNRYVDEQTPEEAPPFEYVERAARGRKTRSRVTVAMVTALFVAGGATFAVVDRPRADQEPAGPETVVTVRVTEGLSDDGPPPSEFKYGRTRMLLAGEARIISVQVDPAEPTVLLVEVPQDMTSSFYCLPNMVVRILEQDDKSVRVAAYLYRLASDQPENQRCSPLATTSAGNQLVHLDLRRPVGIRTVYAGAVGQRTLQY